MDVRVLAATNAKLQEKIDEGVFRQDLYFRLARFPVAVPALRQRKEDIPALAEHFLSILATEMGIDPPGMSAEALAALEEYPFPGNVRELKNIIERALIESGGADIQPEHVYFFDTPAAPAQMAAPPAESTGSADGEGIAVTLPMNLVDAERILVERALEECDGNISAAARLLGTNRPHIYRVLKREGISPS